MNTPGANGARTSTPPRFAEKPPQHLAPGEYTGGERRSHIKTAPVPLLRNRSVAAAAGGFEDQSIAGVDLASIHRSQLDDLAIGA